MEESLSLFAREWAMLLGLPSATRLDPLHEPRRTRSSTLAIIQENTVASKCDICAKGPSFGKSVSHSHRRTSRRWSPNIQSVRTVIGGTSKRLNVCTSCLKAGKVQRTA